MIEPPYFSCFMLSSGLADLQKSSVEANRPAEELAVARRLEARKQEQNTLVTEST
jgi:hypothetical protein